MYEDYFTNLQNTLDIYEGQRSPNDIFRIVKGYSEANGKETNITEFKKKYVANDPNEHVIVIVDHIGLTKPIKDYPTKKQAIDRLVEHLQYFRDHLGYTCIAVSQLNRDLSNPLYKKMDSFEPHLDNIKETGNLGEASDIVLSLFDPIRYNTTDKNYGDVEKFRSNINGHKYFRSVAILKNSYGIDGASIGTVFMGQNGLFKELPKSSEIKDWQQKDYDSIFNHTYFLQKPLIPLEKAIRI
jgi:microsomal dipeptidase-like Zn-dependent dipeptidase